MNPRLDHIALLVRALPDTLPPSVGVDADLGPIQAFPGDGTRERYVGERSGAARLLFIEPLGDGPYRRAFQRRGPGLHHLGLSVADLERYIATLASTGWYLLPESLATISQARTAWLCRPGFPCLIEVSEAAESQEATPGAIERIEVPNPTDKIGLLEALGVPALATSPDPAVWLTIRGQRLGIGELLS